MFKKGRNSLVVVNGEGWCYIFDFLIDTSNDGELPMKPTHVQRIPANTKVLLLHDVNSDGLSEDSLIFKSSPSDFIVSVLLLNYS